MHRKTLIAIILVAGSLLWRWFVSPILLAIPDDFHYEAEIFSQDNFFDEAINDFGPVINSETTFKYDAVERDKDVLTVRNVFDVRTRAGEPIFSVERTYGIDRISRTHVAGAGDKERAGYLIAPRGLKAGQGYVYWHINYDEPATMRFREETELLGLRVFRYETDYRADQTENLTHLPGVPERRGVELDINLQTWVEPVSGYLVKYEDMTTAYYYDRISGQRLHPWNRFNNEYTKSTIIHRVEDARRAKMNVTLLETIIPMLLAISALLILLPSLLRRRQ